MGYVLGWVVGFAIGLCLGGSAMLSSHEKDCASMGAFRIGKTVYKCEKQEGKSNED